MFTDIGVILDNWTPSLVNWVSSSAHCLQVEFEYSADISGHFHVLLEITSITSSFYQPRSYFSFETCIHPSILSTHSFHQFFPSIYPSIHPYTHPTTHPSILLPIYPPNHIPTYPKT